MKTSLLILANLCLITTVVLYFINVVKNGVTPNPAAFLIRSIVAGMNLFSYFAVVNKDYMKLSVSIVSTAGLISIFLYALLCGKLTRLRVADIVCGSLALVIGIIWKTTGDPIMANMMLQIIMLLAFYPAISGVLFGKATERAFPWLIATLCYVFMIGAIVVDWKQSGWLQLVHPVVSGLFGNGALTIAIWWKNRKNKPLGTC